MIPSFNHSHVLPPFAGDSPTQAADRSPYLTSASELVQRMGTSVARVQILRGLFAYRARLRDLGFVDGFQWLDGSFVENIEIHEARDPNDIDVVTFAKTPAGLLPADVLDLPRLHPEVFDLALAKQCFRCDAYFVRLDGRPEHLVTRAAYYHGLFSHRRGDQVWKGMLMLPLQSDDAEAVAALDRFAAGDSDVAPA